MGHNEMKDGLDKEPVSHRDLPSLLVAAPARLTYGGSCFQPRKPRQWDILHRECLKRWFTITEFKISFRDPVSLGEVLT